MNRIASAIAALLCASTHPVQAAEKASLADVAWLQGNWEGEGIGGAPAIEVYSPPAGGQMIGHFRQLKADGSVMFYEIVTIAETEGTLVYRLKHFNADLTGWEEKAEVESFPLTARTAGRVEFSGLVYERTGPDTMIASVVVEEDGKRDTLVFRFRRKGQ